MTTTQHPDTPAAPAASAAPAGPAGSENPVLRVPPATPAAAAAHFAAALAFHTDVSDVAAALKAHREQGTDLGFQLIDSRSTPAWDQAHIPGAIHLPTALIPQQAEQLLDKSLPVVTYCWGPGCNGATRSALALARLGFQVKEVLGGIEYWIREGFEVETWQGRQQRGEADPLTAPTDSGDCGC
ncbi:rhodanese-like domain-containing protein [Streptomyces sp. BR123]|uniref:rhodanese-like domain-containing protein n=1 Tax=Streptomyces sp. BR123 TaxID=2749828 RepID=UPI0015C44AF1|nr:rhodanese-like domain-containing protein [Streptomyces sp. BR123]NXY93464.1 rhodanese-like domain-containing protein [Streptomyces sp. BR123]